MAQTTKAKLNTLYRVSPIKENFVSGSKPSIEIYSASGDVTIRATTNPDFTGALSSLPAVTEEAAQGEVYVTDCGDNLKFVGFSCSDSTAVILVSGLNLIESPQHKVDTYSVTDAGEDYKVGDILKITGEGVAVDATFEVVSYTPADEEEGTDPEMTVRMLDDGEFESAQTEQAFEVSGGSGEGAEITITTKAIY